MPDENEQYEAYKKVVKGMGGRPVTIRTFDLGNDKDLRPDASLHDRVKTNPALGRRAIRLSLAEPQMFQTQLRAILRASKYGQIKLLIPMLAHAHEIDQTLAAIEQAKSSLRGEKITFDENIQVGGMIEIPAAALAIGLFLRRLDFLSIGTNDLIQYTLAIDRSDEQVSSLYDPLHPAVLMLLAHTISSAEKVGIPVSVCGEMAGDPKLTRLFLGMGLRYFLDAPVADPQGQEPRAQGRRQRNRPQRPPHAAPGRTGQAARGAGKAQRLSGCHCGKSGITCQQWAHTTWQKQEHIGIPCCLVILN
jgi:phosphoenolpyruvate-protein phosphotransferase (PTS system enzyme I)